MSGLAPAITDTVAIRDGERLFFGEWPGDEPAFVFAHGLTSTHRNIAGVAAKLDGAPRVVAPDLLGRGNSSAPAPGAYGMEAHGRDLVAFMDALGIERAIVGGHSMGAYVATAAAVFAPERAIGLVLLDGGVYIAPPGGPEFDPDEAMATLLGPVVERMRRDFASPEEYRDFWKSMPYFGEDWGPVVEDYLLYDLGRRGARYGSKCNEDAVREDWRDLLVNPATGPRLAEVRCPVLAVGAESGLVAGQPSVLGDVQVDVLRQRCSDVEFVRVAGTTHHTVTLSERGASATAEAIRTFAARLGGSRCSS